MRTPCHKLEGKKLVRYAREPRASNGEEASEVIQVPVHGTADQTEDVVFQKPRPLHRGAVLARAPKDGSGIVWGSFGGEAEKALTKPNMTPILLECIAVAEHAREGKERLGSGWKVRPGWEEGVHKRTPCPKPRTI